MLSSVSYGLCWDGSPNMDLPFPKSPPTGPPMENWSRDMSMFVMRESRVTLRGDNDRSWESRGRGRSGLSFSLFSDMSKLSGESGLSRKESSALRVREGPLSARELALRLESEVGGGSLFLLLGGVWGTAAGAGSRLRPRDATGDLEWPVGGEVSMLRSGRRRLERRGMSAYMVKGVGTGYRGGRKGFQVISSFRIQQGRQQAQARPRFRFRSRFRSGTR